MNIIWPSGKRTYKIKSSWRKESVKKLGRKRLRSFSASVSSMSSISASFIKQAAIEMKKEMRLMCSDKLDSCLHDSEEGILFFKWDHLFQEFSQTMPKCVQMFLLLIPGTNDEENYVAVCNPVHVIEKEVPQNGINAEGNIYFTVWEWLLKAGTF